ncbi:peptide chain release factor 1 [Enterobacteriaceae endosymbiont of Macroplea mutica]|uniref:peptide chain release factor 1 n=1 Tax=Enterobacteriaceae endosymbiont of Macroplea mutica TaxID=2675791 RepID=UPI001448E3BF|nr:peptide chain release factor 1 [Enterobacteriaceae endosymbiont of Macroplea mutica]QJC31141.1 peptide chain release factor 1 [Enterobacteriaceae endosymbiont of Macroplea mutica]
MKKSIIDKLNCLFNTYKNLEKQFFNNKTYDQNYKNLTTKYNKLSFLMKLFMQWKKIQKDLRNNQNLLQDKELHSLALEDNHRLQLLKNNIEKKIQISLFPENNKEQRNCFLEIRSGSGGKEAAIFVSDISRMYMRYAESKKWEIDIIHIHYGEHGGYKEIIIKIIGYNAYGTLKFESGGHRVQRVPETESQGRIHTSTCIIAVLPELLKKEIPIINTQDLKIDTFRSSGAGGQHVNTTDSAIRITHLPTGIVVACQDERSQHKNKSKALAVLASRITTMEQAKRNKNTAFKKKTLLGSGDRSDRIRTYNYIQKRVTDHRINLTIYRLEEIMNGKLDMLIEPIKKTIL